MRIYCTVIRKNGTYKTVPVKAGEKEFELDKHKYNVRNYRIGSIGFIKILRAFYHEGLPEPLEFDIDYEMKKAHLKIDSKAFKTILNKKILGVFGEEEFTKLEKIVIMIAIVSAGLSAVNLILLITIMNQLSSLGV